MTEDDITEIRKEHYEAKVKLSELLDIVSTLRFSLVETLVNKTLEDAYGKEIRELKENHIRLKSKLAEATETYKLSRKPSHPVGTKLFLWATFGGDVWGKARWVNYKQGAGLFEVFTRESLRSANYQGLITVGDEIIRFVKKDGKPGLKFCEFPKNKWPSPRMLWVPEGVMPEQFIEEYKKELAAKTT